MSSLFYYEPFYDFEKLLDEALSSRQPNQGTALRRSHDGQGGATVGPLKPRLDLHEDSQSNTVTAYFEFPGLKKEDVSIDVHNGRLTVSGESKTSTSHDEHGYAIRERKFGRFSRTLQLPQGVKEDEIRASMENGVLSVVFPKSSPEAPKKISIA
ncbi:hypothetical protein DXG01_008215 [Tephrocybe rancida]|nr:hypothetical protein DXG01_008215 [Tephrocybe rancida]